MATIFDPAIKSVQQTLQNKAALATGGKGGKAVTPGTKTGMTYVQPKTGKMAPASTIRSGSERVFTKKGRTTAEKAGLGNIGGTPPVVNPVLSQIRNTGQKQQRQDAGVGGPKVSVPYPSPRLNISPIGVSDLGGGWKVPKPQIGPVRWEQDEAQVQLPDVNIQSAGWSPFEVGPYSGYYPEVEGEFSAGDLEKIRELWYGPERVGGAIGGAIGGGLKSAYDWTRRSVTQPGWAGF